MINSSDNDLIREFFFPLLKNSVTYDRGVGYFSSGWLRVNASGLIEFAHNNGSARWVTSPILSKEDWEAMKLGDDAKTDEVLRRALSQNIVALKSSLERKTLSALAWLMADGILEFKLATLRGRLDGGEFHDKFGVFKDADNNQISFSGSYNESMQGLKNYESFKVFKSWIPEQRDWVHSDANRFERLWHNMDPNVRVLEIGEANKEAIVKLRTLDRPYGKTASDETPDKPNKSFPILRDYQEVAVQRWFDNRCQGFLEMATGTGKTITSIAAGMRLYQQLGRLGIIVAVPYQHLVDQWEVDVSKFGIKPILAYKNKSSWLNTLNETVIEYNNGFVDFFCVITTHTTFGLKPFQETIGRLSGSALIIADEAHHLGTETARRAYPTNVQYRLALSATPDRWFDDTGSAALRSFFGRTVFEFSLKDAIGVTLTPYYYIPCLVELTDEEMQEYERYSVRISKLASMKKPDSEEKIKGLLMKRAELLNKAANKLAVLADLIDQNPVESHTLFYCAAGQMDEVMQLVGMQKGIIAHPFTSNEDNAKRQELLKDFAAGTLQALVAIRCLDEGVDVPSTKVAYLLASTSNPREFIQRRGRILRKAEGKEFSILYDLITIPPHSDSLSENNLVFRTERAIIKKELSRFKEFADFALNKHQAIDKIWGIAERYHLTDF